MKDFPIFDTATGISSLILKEIPYKQTAYIRIRTVEEGGLREHLSECVSFARMCGAERVYATGHDGLTDWPLYCAVISMAMLLPPELEPQANLFPVTEETVGKWRSIYNEKMGPVDNAATMTARDEKEILSGGAYFVHKDGELLGIGWMKGSELLCVAAVKPGAGERVTLTMLTLADSERVTLEVASTNLRARRLYERMGFAALGERSCWYQIL